MKNPIKSTPTLTQDYPYMAKGTKVIVTLTKNTDDTTGTAPGIVISGGTGNSILVEYNGVQKMKTRDDVGVVGLTKENIKIGILITSLTHPEWGRFRVTKHYDQGVWEIGERILVEDEFKFWAIAA